MSVGGNFARRHIEEDLGEAEPVVADGRLMVTALPRTRSTLADDVLRGLASVPKELPPKHFYDARGAELFDAICDTPEYYPTRTELGLLERVADEVVADADPTDIIEIGSGAARKTRALLTALGRHAGAGRYVPIDISEQMLIDSSRALLADYPWLRVHGLVADYEQRIGGALPEAGRRMFLFLGSTIGNFDPPSAAEFLRRIRRFMRADDSFLLGMDLVKAPGVLYAAYNDARGITAEFNRNVLRVINRELAADFDPDAFEHLAFFRTDLEQVEMHLRARRAQTIHLGALRTTARFGAGETVRTEISRKFTRASADILFRAAGLRCRRWLTPDDGYFALALLEPS